MMYYLSVSAFGLFLLWWIFDATIRRSVRRSILDHLSRCGELRGPELREAVRCNVVMFYKTLADMEAAGEIRHRVEPSPDPRNHHGEHYYRIA